MKRKIIYLVFLISIISFDLSAQIQSVTLYNNYRRELVKNGSDPVECPRGLLPDNSASLVGREPGPKIYRDVWQWDIPDNIIPDGSEINSVHLSIKCTNNTATQNLYAVINNITYDIISEDYFDEIFDQMVGQSMADVISSNGYLDFQSSNPQNDFNQAIRNSLPNDKFVIGIRWNNDILTTSQTWYLSNYFYYNELDIEFTPPTKWVTIDQRNSSNQPVGVLKKWEWDSDDWGSEFNPGSQFPFDVGSEQVIHGDQETIDNEKYNNWNALPDVTNHHSFVIDENTDILTSYFISTDPTITIQNALEGFSSVTGGDIKFADPWYIDFQDGAYGNSWRNRGMEEPRQFYTRSVGTNGWHPDFTTVYPESPYPYNGIFLNQSGPPLWTPPYYSVQSSVSQTIPMGGRLGTRNYQFIRWSGTNVQLSSQGDFTYQSNVVFTNDNAVVNANLKGHLLSDDQQTLSTGSKRRLVRTDNGIYHLVYESMGWIWYTYSLTTNFNGAWSEEQPIWGKNPSQDFEGNNLLIVMESEYSPTEAGIYLITIVPDENGNYNYDQNFDLIATFPYSYIGNSNPVIATNIFERFFVYRKNSNYGLYYKRMWNNGNWHYDAESTIPHSSFTSINPSISIEKQGPYDRPVHIVFQDGNLYPAVKYIRWNGTDDFSPLYIISSTSGFNTNYFPSISLFRKTNGDELNFYEPIVSWLGSSTGTLSKSNGASIPDPRVVVRAATNSEYGSWGSINVFGESASSAQNNSVFNVFNKSVITWGQGDGSEAKWVKRDGSTYYGPYCLLPAGLNTAVSNGNSLSEIKASTLDCSAAPYIINQSPESFLAIPDCGGIQKVVTTYPYTFSRAGVILLKGIEFTYHTGDVVVDDSAMQFIGVPDTLTFSSPSELNQILRTDDFLLHPNSSLVFSNRYYVLNKDLADSVLTGDESVAFRVELVNSASGNVTGTFDNIEYDKNNLDDYENVSYQVDCSGIAEGSYYLRLVISVSGDAEYNLINAVNDASYLAKRSFRDISFTGEKLPAIYSLSQNFPNPFNPTTTINYQIPQPGLVTLKVYDILGREVATLVNEQKNQGRYSVNFDASKLASGVYIYQVRANDFVSSKKMLLIK